MGVNELSLTLKENGYLVEAMDTHVYKIHGQSVFGYFSDKCEDIPLISGRIAVDHDECFDKLSRCPISLPLPNDEKDMNFLLETLEYLSSSEGELWASEIFYPVITEYPKE